MNIRRKLLKGGHLSEKKCLEILHLFCEDLTATEIADASSVSRVTINNYFRLLRSVIVSQCLHNKLLEHGFQGGNYYAFYLQNGKVVSEWLEHNFMLPANNNDLKNHHAIADSRNWALHWTEGDGNNLSSTQEDIATFWMFTKARLQKFRGMSKNTTYLHIKESEFRYNHRDCDMFSVLIETIQKSGEEKTAPWQHRERISFS